MSDTLKKKQAAIQATIFKVVDQEMGRQHVVVPDVAAKLSVAQEKELHNPLNWDPEGNWMGPSKMKPLIAQEAAWDQPFDYSQIFDKVVELAKDYRELMTLEVEDQVHPLFNMTCMSCFAGKYVKMASWNLQCDNCKVVQRGYIPQPAFAKYHQDRSRIKFNFGGYGAGKTTANINEDIAILLQMPGARILIGMADLKQLSGVAMLEFFTWMPESAIAKTDKKNNELTLTNGSHVYFRPLINEEKIKSLNLNRGHIIEASAIRVSQQRKIFMQLQKRIRNKFYHIIPDHGTIALKKYIQKLSQTTNVVYDKGFYKIDMRQIVVEANPVDDYFMELALKAQNIFAPDNKYHRYDDLRPHKDNRNAYITTWVMPSYVNSYLAPGLIAEWKSTMDENEYKNQVEGSLRIRKFGAIFNNLRFVEPFAIPRHWKRVLAMDSGIVDSRTILALAINPQRCEYVVYGLLGKSYWTIKEHASFIKNHLQQLPFNILYKPIQADKQLFNTRDNDKGDGFTSNAQVYERQGLSLTKAFIQDNAKTIEQGVAHLNNIAKQNMLCIMHAYNDPGLNHGMIIIEKALLDIRKYARDIEGNVPQRKGVDFPDTLRFGVGPLPSDKAFLKQVLTGSFYQDPWTAEISYEKPRNPLGIITSYVDPLNLKQQIQEKKAFLKYSPFKI